MGGWRFDLFPIRLSKRLKLRGLLFVLALAVFASPTGWPALASSQRPHAPRHRKVVAPPKRPPLASKRPPVPSYAHKGLTSYINSWLARPELSHSLVGVDVMELGSGHELLALNGHRRFTPASTAKLFVTACAYETLGPTFTFKTKLATKSPVDGDKIDGDILIVPSQDPTLGREDLTQLLNGLSSRGIHAIQGRFVQCDVAGGGERFLAEWLSEDWGQDWMPVSSSFVVDRNVSSPGFLGKVKMTVKGAKQAEDALKKTLLAAEYTPGWLTFEPEDRSVTVYQAGEHAGAQALKAVANPDEYNQALITEMATQAGFKIGGHSFENNDGPTMILCEHESQPLAQIIKLTLKESDNLYAQQLLRTLGMSQANTNAKIALNLEQRGLQKIKSWLESIGVPKEEVVLWDGCGLSRKNYVSPYALNIVLRHMALHPSTGGFISLLTQGTITPKGSYQFKTGAMDSVRCVAGVLTNFEGKRLLLSVLVNGHTPSVRDVRTSIGTLINQLAQAKVDPEPKEANASAK